MCLAPCRSCEAISFFPFWCPVKEYQQFFIQHFPKNLCISKRMPEEAMSSGITQQKGCPRLLRTCA